MVAENENDVRQVTSENVTLDAVTSFICAYVKCK
jgi:hypothetical protein